MRKGQRTANIGDSHTKTRLTKKVSSTHFKEIYSSRCKNIQQSRSFRLKKLLRCELVVGSVGIIHVGVRWEYGGCVGARGCAVDGLGTWGGDKLHRSTGGDGRKLAGDERADILRLADADRDGWEGWGDVDVPIRTAVVHGSGARGRGERWALRVGATKNPLEVVLLGR